MPEGGDLNVRCYSSGPTVVLEIADNGIGMPVGSDPFELFKTTKPGGNGLGLPIVEQIVRAHNGTMIIQARLARYDIQDYVSRRRLEGSSACF
jgi:two-component system, NtrC family, sensor histidine kinase HydH